MHAGLLAAPGCLQIHAALDQIGATEFQVRVVGQFASRQRQPQVVEGTPAETDIDRRTVRQVEAGQAVDVADSGKQLQELTGSVPIIARAPIAVRALALSCRNPATHRSYLVPTSLPRRCAQLRN